MKALSIKEPWISMIVEGKKTIEIRTWATKYRGQLLLVGCKNPPGKYAGMAACVVEIDDVRPMTKLDKKKACYKFCPGAQSWHLKNIRKVKPFPVKGRLSFYEVPDEKIEYLVQ